MLSQQGSISDYFAVLPHLGENTLRSFALRTLLSFLVRLPLRPLFLVFLINAHTFLMPVI